MKTESAIPFQSLENIMNTLKISLIAVILAASTAAVSYAEGSADAPKGERAKKMQEHFKAADKNGDGKISREEANASMPRVAKHFDEIDANKDGFVTKEEMRAFHEKHRGHKDSK